MAKDKKIVKADENEVLENSKIYEIDFMKDDKRDLSRVEYKNIKEKSELGAIPVEYLRKNLFNPTGIKDATIASNFKKVIFENDEYKISVNKYLHQRHKDVLTILFGDNLGVSSPMRDGSYNIYINLTHIAKLLGYANPNSSIQRVKEYLNDLRYTDLQVFDKKTKIEHGHQLLGEYTLDTEDGFYKVTIPSKTAKYHILNFAVEIPKEINRLILNIPIKYPRLKATITYILSNTILKNGIGLETIMKQFDMTITPKSKSLFKKEIEDNIEILNSFNIHFDSLTKKFTLKEQLNFIRNVTHNEAIESYKKDGRIEEFTKPKATPEFEYDNVIDINYLKMNFENKYIRLQDKNYLVKDFVININEATQNDNICIVAVFSDFQVTIPTKTMNFETVFGKIQGYNTEYLDFKNSISDIKF